ncbi:hypothetical protein [Streptomyces sp. MN13]
MTTPNGGQQGAAQALGNLLGQGIPFGAQSAGQAQPQAAGAGQQQLDPQFLGVLLPILSTVAQGIISQLSAQQGQPSSAQPQGAMGGQPQGVSPQFFPGFPFAPPRPENLFRGGSKVVEGIGDIFGLSAQQGQPQAAGAGQQQLDPQFVDVLLKMIPIVAEPVMRMIAQSAPQGQPSSAQPQGAMGGQPQGVSPQFFPGFPFAPPRPEDLFRGGSKVVEGIGDIFGLSAQQGQPQAAGAGQQQLDPQFVDVLLKVIPIVAEPVMRMIAQSAQQGQPSSAQPQGVGPMGAGQPMAAAGWR